MPVGCIRNPALQHKHWGEVLEQGWSHRTSNFSSLCDKTKGIGESFPLHMCTAGSAVVAEVSDDNLFSMWFSQLAIIDLIDLLEIPEDCLPQKESHPFDFKLVAKIINPYIVISLIWWITINTALLTYPDFDTYLISLWLCCYFNTVDSIEGTHLSQKCVKTLCQDGAHLNW